MHSRNISALTLCTLLNLVYIVTMSIITEVTELSTDYWSKNEECCTATYPEDFKYCVTHRRHALPAPYLGFKSISCQCHAPVRTSGDRSQDRRVQIFRQCMLSGDENTEEQSVHADKIFKACKEGNLAAVKHIILNQPEKIYTHSRHGRTPVMVAAFNGRMDVFNFLACHTCRWNDTDKYNNNILHLASMGGSLNIAKQAVRFADIESKGEHKRTAVLLAIRYGHIAIAEMLIQAGCNVKVVDNSNHNLLHMALKCHSMKVLRYVFAIGHFSLQNRDSKGRSPLLIAVERGFLEGFKYLIEQGADVTAVDKKGNTVLHYVILCKKSNNVRIDMMNYFLSKAYVSKESKGRYKQTPLLLSAWKGDLDVFKLLVKEGCSTHIVDEDGDNILHLAANGGHYVMVKYILDKSYISPMLLGSRGRTVLMRAATNGSLDIFKLLQGKGCNLTTLDHRGNSVVHYACKGGHVKMINYILSKNQLEIDTKGAHGYTPLMYTVRLGKVEAFTLMFKKRCSTKNRDDRGNTILHLACISGNMDMVKLLIQHNLAQHYIHEKNDEDKTPKQLTEAMGFDEIDKLLKEVLTI